MEISKVQGYLNIAQKGGYVIWGGEILEDYHKKLYLVLFDPTAQKNTKKVVAKLQERDIPVLEIENLGVLLNKPNCKIIGIKNKNLSDQISLLLK